jgi:hypothetical protein
VQRLRRWQPLLLVPEPSNAYDPLAVAVMTLGGEQVGYLPRAVNAALGPGSNLAGLPTAGVVISVGRAAQEREGPWGAIVRVHVSALPLLPLPLPPSYYGSEHEAELMAACNVGSPAYRATLQRAGGACQVKVGMKWLCMRALGGGTGAARQAQPSFCHCWPVHTAQCY